MQNSIATNFELLQFIDSKKLSNWSVKYLLEGDFGYNENYELVPISTFLKRSKEQVTIQDNTNYKRITIRQNNGGISLRDKLPGTKIGTKKQFLVRKGQFLLSKIDARNGAFGVVPDDVDGAIITGNFWTYNVDYSKVDPYYLALITTTPQFISFCQRSSAGTTNRHYLQETLFLKERIPLPLLSEQEEFSKAYRLKLQQADKWEQEATNLENEIEQYLDEKLGIKTTKREFNNNSLSFIDFKDISKWGLDQIFSSKTIYDTKYPTSKIELLCNVGSGGTPSRSRKDYYTGKIPWIKTGEVINDVIYDTEEKITEQAIANSSAKIYPKGSLIIAMYGQGKTRGRTAKLGVEATTNQACAVLSNIKDDVLTDYLWIYLMNEYDRLRELASGNNQPNLNSEMIKKYQVVIPPKDVQKSIISDYQKLKNSQKHKFQQAQQFKKQALLDFENAIFKPAE